MTSFERWWNAWAERNEALFIEAQRERELAVARRWADAHMKFWFGDANSNSTEKDT